MIEKSWTFLTDPENRAVVGWICAGLLTLATAAVKLLISFKNKKTHSASVAADRGSVAIGGTISHSNIKIDNKSGKNV